MLGRVASECRRTNNQKYRSDIDNDFVLGGAAPFTSGACTETARCLTAAGVGWGHSVNLTPTLLWSSRVKQTPTDIRLPSWPTRSMLNGYLCHHSLWLTRSFLNAFTFISS